MSTPWLARYTADPASLRLWQSVVHSVGSHSVATDARGILAVRDGGRVWPPDTHQDYRSAGEKNLRSYLEAQPDCLLTTTLDDLAAWCEYVEWCVCDTCGDEQPNRDYCEGCDGEGRWLPSPLHLRPGLLAGVPLDRNRLGWMLAAELWDLSEDRTVSVGVHPRLPNIVILDGARWRLVLVGVDVGRHADVAHEARFDPDPLFRHLWLDRHSEGKDKVSVGAMALADWRMEREGGTL